MHVVDQLIPRQATSGITAYVHSRRWETFPSLLALFLLLLACSLVFLFRIIGTMYITLTRDELTGPREWTVRSLLHVFDRRSVFLSLVRRYDHLDREVRLPDSAPRSLFSGREIYGQWEGYPTTETWLRDS